MISHQILPSSQLAIFSREGLIESMGNHRDRGRMQQRDCSSGRPRLSRSRSLRNKSPNAQFRKNREYEVYPLSACQICLSRKKHAIRKCQASTLWDGQHKTRCSRTPDRKIIDSSGHTLCSNWNQTIGCNDKSSRHIHECSGCGESSHGAQESLGERGQLTGGYMLITLWFFKQFVHTFPRGDMLITF